MKLNKLLLLQIVILFLNIPAMFGQKLESEDHGKLLFRQNCKACHSLDKKLVGPALKDVHIRRDSGWLMSFIKNSQQMITSGDSTANKLFNDYNKVLMPAQKLENDDIFSILNYIKDYSETGSAVALNPIQRPIIQPKYYTDHFRFSNFIFWIPFTISVILLMIVLYYLTVHYDLVKENNS